MRKLGQIFLAGTTLSAFVSVVAIEAAQAEPLRLAAAACPQGQVGVPPNCKPAPGPQRTPPPQQPVHPQVQQPVQHPQVQQPVQHPQVQQPVQHPQVQERKVTPPVHPQVEERKVTPPVHPQVEERKVTPPVHPQVEERKVTPPVNPKVEERKVTPPVNPKVEERKVTPPVNPKVEERKVTPPVNPQVEERRVNPQVQQPQLGTRVHPSTLPNVPLPTASQAKPLEKHNGPAALVPTTPQGQQIRSVTGLRAERHESVVGGNTVITEGNRVIVRESNGAIVIRHDDVDRFRYGARDVKIEKRGNDSISTIVLGNGSRVVTTLGPDGRILRRSRFGVDGREIVLIAGVAAVGAILFVNRPEPMIRIPRDRYIVDLESAPPDYVYGAFTAPPVEQVDQGYSLDQVLASPSVRDLMPSVDLDTITFETGSWEIGPEQVDRLSVIADSLSKVISANPREVFLVEGHTDAVGNDVDNMSLSDRRAETVALILSDKFGVPPENLVTQGYGSQYLRVPTQGAERRNRRVTLRRITPLLAAGN